MEPSERWRELLDQRLAEAVADLGAVPGVRGLIVCGSIGRGQPWPLSDIDLVPIYAGSFEPAGEVKRRQALLIDWWASSGRAQTLDVGWLAFTDREVLEATAGGPAEAGGRPHARPPLAPRHRQGLRRPGRRRPRRPRPGVPGLAGPRPVRPAGGGRPRPPLVAGGPGRPARRRGRPGRAGPGPGDLPAPRRRRGAAAGADGGLAGAVELDGPGLDPLRADGRPARAAGPGRTARGPGRRRPADGGRPGRPGPRLAAGTHRPGRRRPPARRRGRDLPTRMPATSCWPSRPTSPATAPTRPAPGWPAGRSRTSRRAWPSSTSSWPRWPASLPGSAPTSWVPSPGPDAATGRAAAEGDGQGRGRPPTSRVPPISPVSASRRTRSRRTTQVR